MTREEILACAGEAVSRGYGTVVMQSGEDPDSISNGLERHYDHQKGNAAGGHLRLRGANGEGTRALERSRGRSLLSSALKLRTGACGIRFILRERGYAPSARPPGVDQRAWLRAGSGIMVGIPGQTWDSWPTIWIGFSAWNWT